MMKDEKEVIETLSDNTRDFKVFSHINSKGLGLEIGPSHNPIAPKKSGYNCEILDHATAEELREKYKFHNVNIDAIEDVDYVWQGQPLNELIGEIERYDYIIASHVIEHTPNLVGFIQQCQSLLKPTGVLSLIIPDKRYCFDFFRPLSTSGDVLQAHLENRKKHVPGVVFDYVSSTSTKNGMTAWGEHNIGDMNLIHDMKNAERLFKLSQISEDYIDVHQWRFTPTSFELIMHDLNFLCLTELNAIASYPTSGCEFYFSLAKGQKVSQLTKEERTAKLEKIHNELLAVEKTSKNVELLIYNFLAPHFDIESYLSNNQDVKNARIDPLQHWIEYGVKEGRKATFNK